MEGLCNFDDAHAARALAPPQRVPQTRLVLGRIPFHYDQLCGKIKRAALVEQRRDEALHAAQQIPPVIVVAGSNNNRKVRLAHSMFAAATCSKIQRYVSASPCSSVTEGVHPSACLASPLSELRPRTPIGPGTC